LNPSRSFCKNPSTGGAQIGVPGTAAVGIVSDVTGFAFATNSYVVGENGSNVLVTVNRLNPNTGTLSVSFATSDNTAINGVDYVATNGLLTFLDGQATSSFNVRYSIRTWLRTTRAFNIGLFSPSTNAFVVAPSNTVVTITNVYVGIAFGSPSFTVSECAVEAVIPVVLSGLTNSTDQVLFGTTDGSGKEDENYFPTNGTLEFLPGQTVAYFDVKPINNHIIGPDHTVVLNLTNGYPAPPNVGGVQLLNPSTAAAHYSGMQRRLYHQIGHRLRHWQHSAFHRCDLFQRYGHSFTGVAGYCGRQHIRFGGDDAGDQRRGERLRSRKVRRLD
jgi:hypothetical protein